MGATVAAARGNAQGNTLSLPLLGAVPQGQDMGNADALWMLPLVARAVDRCMSRKEAALRLGLSESALSRQLSGADGKVLNFARFGALGDPVAIALADELRAHFHLDDPAARMHQAMELVGRGMALLVSEARR